MYTLSTKARFYLKTTLNMKYDQTKEINQLWPTKRPRNGPRKQRHNTSQHSVPVLGNSLTQRLTKLENELETGELGKTSSLNTNTRALDVVSSLDQTTRDTRANRWAFSLFLDHEYETRKQVVCGLRKRKVAWARGRRERRKGDGVRY